MTHAIVIFGKQGCGKTQNADKLAKHFGKGVVIDEFCENVERRDVLTDDTLALAISMKHPLESMANDERHTFTSVLLMNFENAMKNMERSNG